MIVLNDLGLFCVALKKRFGFVLGLSPLECKERERAAVTTQN